MTPLLFFLFLFLWIAFVGGTVGSFLNVVVYRVPAGMSVVHPPSRCPRCEHAIRWYDNIPVLGWLWLRGRCRDCGVSISRRYPIVEAITSLMFVAVAWADGIDRAWYETFVAVRSDVGFDECIYICCRYLLHVVLLSVVWAAALMQYDRHIPPLRMTLGAAIGLGLATAILHELWRIPVPLFWDGSPFRPIEILIIALVLTAFAMLSTYFWTVRPREHEHSRWTFAEWSFVAALVLSSNDFVLAIVAAVMFGLIASFISRRSDFPLLCLFAGLVFAVVLGEPLADATARLARRSPTTQTMWNAIWHTWYPVTIVTLVVLMAEACAVIRRRTQVALPDDDNIDESTELTDTTLPDQGVADE